MSCGPVFLAGYASVDNKENRGDAKPIWRISLFTNINLVIVIAVSFSLQLWSQHNTTLDSFLRTSYMPFTEYLLLLAVCAIPLLILEMVKVVRGRPGEKTKNLSRGET